MSKRPGDAGGAPEGKRVYAGGRQEFMDSEPMLPEEYEDPDDEDVYMDDVLDQKVIKADAEREHWKRKPAPEMDPAKDTIVFQQLDIDYIIGAPHALLSAKRRAMGHAAALRIFGVTAGGNSVCVHVHGFEPYFYAKVPESFKEEQCEGFRKNLNELMSQQQRGGNRGDNSTFISAVTLVRDKQSLMYYQEGRTALFVRVTTTLPAMVSTARGILEKQGLHVPALHATSLTFQTFESNVLYTLRFMVDMGVVGGNWVELPAGGYQHRHKKSSMCQYEIDVLFDQVVSHPPEGQYSKLAPFRILSMDIECAGRRGHFPDAEHDPVIQIATMVTCQGDDKPIIKAIWTLDTCAPIVGSDVLSFTDERELLRSWGKFLRSTDPDLLIGYNIVNFDFPYLINRAAKLGVEDFPYWGRMLGSKLRMKDTTFSSKAYGTRDSKEITIEGRVQFDLLQAVQRDHKLSSYSLNAVSAHFLGEQKEDVHHSAISELQAGTSETRRRLAVYCLKDAYLPQRLLDKLMYMYNYVEMARVTGVPVSFLLSRGQSIKVLSQILRKAKQRGLLVPHMAKKGGGEQAEGGVAYEGATVLDAKAGYYELPIATLDFASLYPSIMMAHNLCYCTLVPQSQVSRMAPEDISRSPTGDVFVKSSKTKGILPEILEELLGARKRAKADLKKAQDPLERAVLDGRQLALKVSANSVYGFTGATVGALPCLEISASTTSYGRNMIDQTKDLVLERYNTKNGYQANADVIYGDTDSVMIKFNVTDLAEAMRLGEEAAAYVSATFIKPIKLEFEKVYWPYLLISKKRYAGLLWTNPHTHDKMDTKGIETVRRDNCLLVRQVIETILQKILISRDVPGAVNYVKHCISDLLMNRMDLSLLVITKGLSQDAEAYDNKAAHVELAKRMKERDPATAPVVGDRIPYVIIKAAKNAKGWEKSEDPIYALEHNLPIDCQHYVDHYLAKPLLRIFDPIMKDAESQLLKGDHTRAISQPTPSNAAGGIMRFAKVRLSCVGCRASIADDKQSTALCTHCLAKESEHLQKALNSVNNLENDFNRLWTQCQRCQGSLHQDVLCTSRDCPIFYRRKKVQKDLLEAETTLKRFDW